jgi:hypothetical protein
VGAGNRKLRLERDFKLHGLKVKERRHTHASSLFTIGSLEKKIIRVQMGGTPSLPSLRRANSRPTMASCSQFDKGTAPESEC